jgi:hypothetical protein
VRRIIETLESRALSLAVVGKPANPNSTKTGKTTRVHRPQREAAKRCLPKTETLVADRFATLFGFRALQLLRSVY